jgi:sterol desaturase/sphingolipid hydroxylase (fatty acid hydroxylase superfamily)
MMVVLVVAAAGLAMLAWEATHPAHPRPSVPGWWPRALLLTSAQALVAWLATATWDRWLPRLAPWQAGGHGVIVDALLGYVVVTFVYYWWHRARHEAPVLWRYMHQVHHSATRIEVATSYYKHPLEVLLNGVLSSFVVYAALGLDTAAATLTVALTGLAELVYHWNVKTPYWLGYFFQRPENHRVHHERGRHTGNFSDLPLWDIAFGTFENTRSAPAECGFAGGAERRLGALLLGRKPEPCIDDSKRRGA